VISRRAFLAGMGVTGVSLLPSLGRATPQSAEATGIVSAQLMHDWQSQLVGFGTRYTGSVGQDRFVDFLSDQLDRMGLEVHADRLSFDRWEAVDWRLRAVDGTPIPLSYYYPYSGETPAGGVTAKVVYCGVQTGRGAFQLPDGRATNDASAFFAPARGAIALIDAPIPPVESSSLCIEPRFQPPEAGALWPDAFLNPVFQGNVNPPDLVSAREAGVLAAICAWTNASDELANGQYNPFRTPYQGLPAVWVTRSTAESVKALATAGSEVTLTLVAERTRNAVSRSIWCRIAGRTSNESLIVNTHTDGGNAVEENGGLGLLAMADYYRRLPRQDIARDIVLVFVTGHFQQPQFTTAGGYGVTSRWKADHPDIWGTAVGGVTVEHLGCTEWNDGGGTRSYAPTGRPEWSLTYTSSGGPGSPKAPMDDVLFEAAERNGQPRSVAVSAPEPSHFLGEGRQFFADRIPVVALVPIPTYLLRAGPDLEVGKMDPNLMCTQVRTMLDLTTRMQSMTARELAGG
jgi:hypothetical protein